MIMKNKKSEIKITFIYTFVILILVALTFSVLLLEHSQGAASSNAAVFSEKLAIISDFSSSFSGEFSLFYNFEKSRDTKPDFISFGERSVCVGSREFFELSEDGGFIHSGVVDDVVLSNEDKTSFNHVILASLMPYFFEEILNNNPIINLAPSKVIKQDGILGLYYERMAGISGLSGIDPEPPHQPRSDLGFRQVLNPAVSLEDFESGKFRVALGEMLKNSFCFMISNNNFVVVPSNAVSFGSGLDLINSNLNKIFSNLNPSETIESIVDKGVIVTPNGLCITNINGGLKFERDESEDADSCLNKVI